MGLQGLIEKYGTDNMSVKSWFSFKHPEGYRVIDVSTEGLDSTENGCDTLPEGQGDR